MRGIACSLTLQTSSLRSSCEPCRSLAGTPNRRLWALMTERSRSTAVWESSSSKPSPLCGDDKAGCAPITLIRRVPADPTQAG